MPTTTSRGRPTVTTTIDRAEINRRNAARSTGPRTPEGKSRSRFNAVKHGCRARLPILPGEDPEVYQHRLDAWVDKFGPRDAVEHYLVERAVHVSWQLDRADRAEVAGLVADLDREAAQRAEEVRTLGAELFAIPPGPIGARRPRSKGPSGRSSPGRSSRSIRSTPPGWSPPWRPPRPAATGCGGSGPSWGRSSTRAGSGSPSTGCGPSGCWASSRSMRSPTIR